MSAVTGFLIVSLLMAVTARPSDTETNSLNQQDLKRLWLEHKQLVKSFPCGEPQLRSFSAAEILGEDLLSSESSFPSSTVLYRCDAQSGCCTNNQECGPSRQQPVTLIFRTLDRLTSKFAFKTVSNYNHTECSCQNQIDTPKR